MIENNEFRLTIKIWTKIKICLDFHPNMIISEYLGIIREQNFINILVVKLDFSTYCC